MQASNIERELAERLEGDAHALWAGLGREAKNDYVIRVQRAGNVYDAGLARDKAEAQEIKKIVAELEVEAAELVL